MKMNIKVFALFFIGMTSVLSSCKKYEDGPGISLRSKEERIANTWKVDKAYENGNDITNQYDQYELQMLRNGQATLVAIYSTGNFNFEFETNGTWDLVNDNDDLRLDFEDDDADRTYQILRLKEKELWLREKGGDVELHLIPR